jgi:hypothetical protein
MSSDGIAVEPRGRSGPYVLPTCCTQKLGQLTVI